jgi:hypothetical protein
VIFLNLVKTKNRYVSALKIFFLLFLVIGPAEAETSEPLHCPKTTTNLWTNCFGISNFQNGDTYVGAWNGGLMHGFGVYLYFSGNGYFGEFKNHQRSGSGIFVNKNSEIYVGEYKNDKRDGVGILSPSDGIAYWANFNEKNKAGSGAFYSVKKNIFKKGFWRGENLQEDGDPSFDCKRLDQIFLNLKENLEIPTDEGYSVKINEIGKKLDLISDLVKKSDVYGSNFCKDGINLKNADKNTDKTSVKSDFSINAIAKNINEIGEFYIDVVSKNIIESISVNGELVSEPKENAVSVKKSIRAGQKVVFTIVATDINGNTDTKTVTVSRPIAESKAIVAALKPAQVKKQPERDAVAVIIGIADYKNLPRADFANDDARVFYDYAIRALGVKPENIRLLVDADADEVAIYRAFKTWLPSRVRASTDVYVFYSGHGLPTADGQGMYLLPQRADRDFVDKTAITQAEINAAIQAAKPLSVTIFLDACYSGQTRTGETLLASARPVALKVERQIFPDSFTVISASQADQISSSSPDLKHGIFSYYLMRGMEGDADANRDGKITAGEMQAYLLEQVSRQAGMQNRVQQPQLIGDANRVLVGR